MQDMRLGSSTIIKFRINFISKINNCPFKNIIYFCDVTLVSEGHQQKEAHKVILSAASPFCLDVLMTNKHSHPFIYMRGIKDSRFVAIINYCFAYCDVL